MPNSRFALHGLAPSLVQGLRPFFASNSRFMRLFQGALDTPLDSPFSTTLSVHGLHFTDCAPSKLFARPFREFIGRPHWPAAVAWLPSSLPS